MAKYKATNGLKNTKNPMVQEAVRRFEMSGAAYNLRAAQVKGKEMQKQKSKFVDNYLQNKGR